MFSNSIFIGKNSVGGAASNTYPMQLELGGGGGWTGPVGMYSAGAAQPPYSTVNTAAPNIKPVIGVPIQTNWLDTTGNYLQHVSTNSSPPVTLSGATVTTTLRMSISEPLLGYPAFNSSAIADDGFYYSSQGTAARDNFPRILMTAA